MKGKVAFGLGEGAYFVRQYNFEPVVGFKPFPGTLNLKLGKAGIRELKKLKAKAEPVKVPKGDFGKVSVLKARIKGLDVPCALVFPEKTSHKETAEVIAPISLRQRLKLKQGDVVEVGPLATVLQVE